MRIVQNFLYDIDKNIHRKRATRAVTAFELCLFCDAAQ